MAYNRLFNQNGSYLVHHNWNSCKTSPFWFMEWQANALASRVLMPKEMFIQKYDEINWDNRCSEPFSNNLTVAAKTIREVAKFFNVSIQAARLRGIELGYDILFGVLNYVDGHYVPDHFTTHYQVPYHKTYCIGFDQFLRLLETDATLQNAVYSGDYIFVENHVCQNNKHWLEMTEDGVALNMWGRHAVDQCCLLFDKESNKLTDPENINLEFLDRETATNFVSLAGVSKDSNYESPDEQDHFLTEVRDVASISKSLPNNVPGALQKLIEWSGLSQAGIAANCLISEKTIQRILHDEDYEPPMETLVALCIGMKLPAVLSLRFIGIAGKNFKSTEKLTAYMTILTTCVNASIDYCNAMLVNLGVKPLTDAARTALKQTQPELFATLI